MKNQSKDIKAIIQLAEKGQLRNKPDRHYLKNKILLFEKILSGLDTIIFIHDLEDDRMVWAHGDFPKILGYNLKEILEFRLGNTYDYFHPDDLAIIMKGDDLIGPVKVMLIPAFSGHGTKTATMFICTTTSARCNLTKPVFPGISWDGPWISLRRLMAKTV